MNIRMPVNAIGRGLKGRIHRHAAALFFSFIFCGLLATPILLPQPAWGDCSFQTDPCNGNIVKITIGGVSDCEVINHADNWGDDTIIGNTRFCNYSVYADFPMPGKAVSIGVEPVVASTSQLHQLDADIDGIYASSIDWEPCIGCCFNQEHPAEPQKIGDQPVDISLSACYAEATHPFTASAALLTWDIVPCEVENDRTEQTSWIGVSIEARQTYCADDPGNCPYTCQSKGAGPGDLSRMGLPTYGVNTSSLGLIVEDTEFAYRSMGQDVVLKRAWNSDYREPKMFGNGWGFRYGGISIQSFNRFHDGAYLFEGTGQSVFYKYTSAEQREDNSWVAGYENTRKSNFNSLRAFTAPGDPTDPTPLYFLYTEKGSRLTRRFDYHGIVDNRRSYRLTAVTDRNGNTLAVNYDGNGRISSLVDATNRATSFEYDGNGRCIAMTTPGNLTARYEYDDSGNMIKSTDLLGTETIFDYDEDGYMTAMTVGDKTTSITWTDRGLRKTVSAITDAAAQVTTYGFEGTATKVVDPLNRIIEYGNTGEGTALVTGPYLETTWTDPTPPGGGDPPPGSGDQGTPPGGETPQSRFVSFDKGLPTELTLPNGTYAIEYDDRGNLVKITDPLGHETLAEWDDADNLVKRTDAMDNEWLYEYDQAGNMTGITTPEGRKTDLTYNSPGQQLTVISDPLGRRTTLTYDGHGNVATLCDHVEACASFTYDEAGIDVAGIVDSLGNSYLLTYDANRRLVEIKNPDGTVRSFGYDAFSPRSMTDENNNIQSLERDTLLRATEFQDGEDNVTRMSYDAVGNLLTVVNALNKANAMTYDTLGRVVSYADPLENTVRFLYDAASNLIGLTDPGNKTTAMEYDAERRLTAVTDAAGNRVVYERDALGRVTEVTNARGQTIGYAYDRDGLLTAKTYEDSDEATYTYDQAGGLTSIADESGVTSFTHDDLGRVSRIEYPDSLAVSITYDAIGNITGIDYPGELSVQYIYNSRNRITTVAWTGEASIELAYDGAGNLLNERRTPGDVTSTYAYDKTNRLLLVDHRRNETILTGTTLTRNALGHVATREDIPPAGLKRIFRNLDMAWSYNDLNQMLEHASSTIAYDKDGNLTGAAGGGFSLIAFYDPENRATEIVQGGSTNRYTYNGLGRRVRTERNGVVHHAHYDHLDRLLFETDDSGALQNSYIYRGNRLAAIITSDDAVYFYHFDHLGNTAALTDSDGGIVNAYLYDEFGEVLRKIETVANPFTYVGAFGVMDEGDGLYFMKNRYYHSRLRRFLQKDPLGFADGHNLYAYVHNNPATFIDPEGQFVGALVVGGFALWGTVKLYNAAANFLGEADDALAKSKKTRIADLVDPASPNYDPNFRGEYADSICRIGEATGNLATEIYSEAAGAGGDAFDVYNALTDE